MNQVAGVHTIRDGSSYLGEPVTRGTYSVYTRDTCILNRP